MTVPVVLDLNFLADAALHFDPNPGHIRVAYFAGLNSGLKIAYEFSTKMVTSVRPEFWTLLAGREGKALEVKDFTHRLSKSTIPNLELKLGWMNESGLRYSNPGAYYTHGMMDATRVGINQVPVYYRAMDGGGWQKPTLDWISSKIIWSERFLVYEKLRIIRMKL